MTSRGVRRGGSRDINVVANGTNIARGNLINAKTKV